MRYKNRYQKWILLCAALVGMSRLGVSYAAWDHRNPILQKIATQTTNVIFASEYEDDTKVKLVYNTTDTENTKNTAFNESADTELDATITYTGKTLNISGMEAFAMSDLLSGEASLTIDYRLVNSELHYGLLQVEAGTYDLGVISLQLSIQAPYWRLCNGNGSWGVGVPEIENIPFAVYELLPGNLGELHGINTIHSCENGVVKGSIGIVQLIPSEYEVPAIKLSSLELSDEINQAIVANQEISSNLEIMTNYNFSIPFELEQEESIVYTNPMQMQGQATLRMYATVIHDITPTPLIAKSQGSQTE